MRTNVKTHSGNRTVVEFDGKQIGLVQSVSMDDNYGLEAASGIGDIHVQEHVPTKAIHGISVSNMTLFKGNMRDAGIAPQNGDDVLKGLVFDIIVYSKDTGQELKAYLSCSYDSGRVEIGAHRITMQSAQLKALDTRGTGL